MLAPAVTGEAPERNVMPALHELDGNKSPEPLASSDRPWSRWRGCVTGGRTAHAAPKIVAVHLSVPRASEQEHIRRPPQGERPGEAALNEINGLGNKI
jgi:hypothetical protein